MLDCHFLPIYKFFKYYRFLLLRIDHNKMMFDDKQYNNITKVLKDKFYCICEHIFITLKKTKQKIMMIVC